MRFHINNITVEIFYKYRRSRGKRSNLHSVGPYYIIVIVSPTTAVLFCVYALSFSAVASRFNLGNKSSTSFFFYIPRSSLTSPPSPRRSQFLTRHPARENKTQRTVVPEQSCWSTCSNGTC